MIDKLIKLASGLFGGGSSVVYMALAGLFFAGYVHYKDVKGDRDRYKAERDIAEQQAEEHLNTITSQARTDARRAQSNTQSETLQKEINDAPQTNNCGVSDAIRIALIGLSERTETEALNPSD